MKPRLGSCHMGTPWQQHSQEAWPQPAPGLWGHSCTPTQPSRPPPEGAWTQREALGMPPVQGLPLCRIDKITPVYSVTSLCSSAGWWEREVWDMFEIFCSNHPDLCRTCNEGLLQLVCNKGCLCHALESAAMNSISKKTHLSPTEQLVHSRVLCGSSVMDQERLLSFVHSHWVGDFR